MEKDKAATKKISYHTHLGHNIEELEKKLLFKAFCIDLSWENVYFIENLMQR